MRLRRTIPLILCLFLAGFGMAQTPGDTIKGQDPDLDQIIEDAVTDIETEEEDADDQEFKRGRNRGLQMQSLILSNHYHKQRKLSQALGYAPIKKQHTVFAPKVEYGTAQEPEEEDSSAFVEQPSILISCQESSHSFCTSKAAEELGDNSKRMLI